MISTPAVRLELTNDSKPRGRAGRTRGFTLIELLVTVTIFIVVGGVAAPMLKQFIDDTAINTQSDVLIESLNYTRSEAVKRNARVTMCRSSNSTGCTTTSAVGTGDWAVGWIVFVDGGTAGTFDGTDEILRVQTSLPAKLRGVTDVADYVSYNAIGQPRLADNTQQAGSLYACALTGERKRRKITIRNGTGALNITRVSSNAQCDA